jgi:hypothetical protein
MGLATMRLRTELAVLTVCGVLLAGFGSARARDSSTYMVSERGYGPVHFGMTLKAAESALGVRFKQDNYTEHDECRYFYPVRGFDGLAFMTSNGIVVRVDVDEGAIATDKGVQIGDTEREVRNAYNGRVRVGPHFYGGLPSHYLRVVDAKGQPLLIFETDGKQVTSYRAGRLPQVEYVEGCL